MEEDFDYSEYGVKPTTRCAVCGEEARAIREECGDGAVEYGVWSEKLKGWVCGPCSEHDYPKGTVLIYRPREKAVEKWLVFNDEDELFVAEVESEEDLEDIEPRLEPADPSICPIQFKWRRTDPWRGYYEPEAEGWVNVHEDCILAYSRDAEELERFHAEAVKMLWGAGVTFAVAFGRTSNIFSTGYDVLVRREDALIASAALKILALKYRDPERFALTALTGKSEGFDEKDRLLLEAYRRLEAGESPDKVLEDVARKAAGR
jgi:hypothetical protein